MHDAPTSNGAVDAEPIAAITPPSIDIEVPAATEMRIQMFQIVRLIFESKNQTQ